MSTEQKICQNCKTPFTIEPADFAFYDKMRVPPPTFCPECRRQRRLAWLNLFNFYKRTCDLTGDSTISIYASGSGIIIYAPKTWYSDTWDAFAYGQAYDFSKPFFAQYAQLLRKVPRPALDNDDGLASVNCMYTNDFAMSKDCYMVVKAWKLENVMYSFYAVSGKDLVDVHTSFGKDEGNYETVNTEHCYQCRYVYDSRSCSDCTFCYDCRNCDRCFMCTGLRGKSYCFQNKEVGKERYQEILKAYALHAYSGVERAKKEFAPILNNHPRKALRMVNCVNCLGDLIYNSRDCTQCFVTLNSERYKFGDHSDGVKDAYDVDAGGGSALAYESYVAAFCANVVGCCWAWHCQDSCYLDHAHRCKDCFGCSGLKDAQYCILNKRYTKQEYTTLLPKIKKHMHDMPYVDALGRTYVFGDYLPIELSIFPYNDSAAQELFPLTRKKVEQQYFRWSEFVKPDEHPDAIPADVLPDSIFDVDDDITDRVIVSKSSDRKYRITEQELAYYRKYKIPLPRESFFERHARRHAMATSYHLYERTSDKSGKPIISSYPTNAPEKVLSIDEYRAEFE